MCPCVLSMGEQIDDWMRDGWMHMFDRTFRSSQLRLACEVRPHHLLQYPYQVQTGQSPPLKKVFRYTESFCHVQVYCRSIHCAKWGRARIVIFLNKNQLTWSPPPSIYKQNKNHTQRERLFYKHPFCFMYGPETPGKAVEPSLELQCRHVEIDFGDCDP